MPGDACEAANLQRRKCEVRTGGALLGFVLFVNAAVYHLQRNVIKSLCAPASRLSKEKPRREGGRAEPM